MALRQRFSYGLCALALMLAGCDAAGPTLSSAPASAQVTSAYFTAPPKMLIKAAREACQNPNEDFVQPHPNVAQCRLLMDPETTAAVILNFNGTIRDLPQLVISLASVRAGDGYVVAGCAFLMVPHPDGKIGRVVQADPDIAAKLSEMLVSIGGKPLRDTPQDAANRCFSL